jgi:hypothetical protein
MNRRVDVGLWGVQGLLAALFLFGGAMKFVMPVEKMTEGAVIAFPGWFYHFIGAAEIAGGVGLVVPWWTGIARWLTPLAAVLLSVIMLGATVLTAMGPQVMQAAVPFLVLVLVELVAFGRWRSLKEA